MTIPEINVDAVQIDTEEAIAGVLVDADLIMGDMIGDVDENAAQAGRLALQVVIKTVSVAEFAALKAAFGQEVA